MSIDKLSDAWLFQEHSKETVRRWVNNLHYFYFKRAWGGHANDGDEFIAKFSHETRQDLLSKLDRLGILLNKLPENHPKPVTGQRYTADEFAMFKNAIKQFADLEQPGHSIVFGHKAFIWISDSTIDITIINTENPYSLIENDFQICVDLEKEFDVMGFSNFIDRSLEKNLCVLSAQKYPELFAVD